MISNNHGSLEETAESGQLHLERLSFAEAEAAFGHVLDGLTSSSYPHGDRLRMTSLVGLAEIRARRARDVTDDVDEWLRGMLCSLALYKEAAEIAESKTDRKRKSGAGSGRTIDNDIRYFEEVLQKSSGHARVLENELVEAVKQEVNARSREKPDFDVEWLQRLVERCCTAGKRCEDNQTATVDNRDNGRQQARRAVETTDQDNHDNGRRRLTKTTDQDNGKQQARKTIETTDQDNRDNGRQQQTKRAIETTHQDNRDNRDEELTTLSTTTTTVEEKTMMESRISQVPVLKRRIDYDRLQNGIRRIVDGVSGDVRGQYRHFRRRIPGQAMQRRLFHELVLRLSPGYRESDDLESVLQDAVQYEDLSMMMACDDLEESRRNLSEEIILRAASKNWKEEEEEEEEGEVEVELSEWGESWEKEEKVRRDDKDKEKEEEEEEDEDDDVETTELRLLPSAVYDKKDDGMQKKNVGITSDERSTVAEVSRQSIVRSFTRKEPGLRTVQSKIQTTDSKTGNSLGSKGAGGGGGGVGPSSRILTLWRSNGSNRVKTEPENRFREPHGFEEISSLTDRDKVLRWLQSVRPETHPKSSPRDRISGPTTTHPSGDRVGQVVGHVVLRVGDAFRKERAYQEAYEMYKCAMGLFQRYPLARGQIQIVTDLLLRVGTVRCSMGQVATGSRMMEESVSVLEWGNEEEDALKVAELWFQVGNVYLAERMRVESLQARVMQLVREELEDAEEEGGKGQDGGGVDDDKSSECDSSSSSSECQSYCVCIYEALNSYRKALSTLDSISGESRAPELVIGVASNMADCYVMTGNLDRAELAYERALRLFPAALGSQPISLNAHVLSMLGTVSFLLGNHARAATMFETASLLLQAREDAETTLEAAWTATMVGLSRSVLHHADRAGVWCARGFAAYTRFFRGRILDVDPLNRWFIVRALYVLGTSLGANDKALYYLNLARNMTTLGSAGDDDDTRHLVKVLMAIAGVYGALGRPDKAREYREEALEYGKDLREYGKKYGDDDDLGQGFHRQDDVQDDMVATLLRLGRSSTLTCDLDRAIDYYSDIVDAFGDAADARHDVAGVMASLGTLCHVKDFMHDADDDSFVNRAERYFEEAFQLTGSTSPACVQYANFLYRRGRCADALTVMLPYVFCSRPADDEVCYSGIEQVVLPDHLQHDRSEEKDTLVMEARVFASFLATLCYNYLGLNRDADDALIQLYRLVIPSTNSLDHVMLGYGLMERGLFEEAAGSFAAAARLQPTAVSGRSTFKKARICYLLFAYLTIARAVDFLLEFVHERSKKDHQSSTFDEHRNYLRAVSSRGVSSPRVDVATRGAAALRTDLEEWKTEAVEKNTLPEKILEPISNPNRNYDLEPPLVKVKEEEEKEEEEEEEEEEKEWEEWTTEEIVVVKTCPQIPNLVANQTDSNHNLNGTAYQRHDDPRSVPESTGGVPERTATTASVNRAEVVVENGRSRPEVDDTPEVNGNSMDTDSSSDEWIVTEEVIVDTPEEILALLRKKHNGLKC